MKLSDYVIKFIADQGVKHIFMMVGGGCMHLVDSVGSSYDLKYICNLHEQGCAVAAEAYGQYTGLGAALVTTGPGGTNAITGVAGAWLDSTPCIFLSGQVKTADMKTGRGVRQMGFQELDIEKLVSPITKYAATVTDPKTIRYHLEKAAYLAQTGRPGPVWIDIPLDIQAADIDPKKLKGFKPPKEKKDNKALKKKVKQVVELLKSAERPVLLVGNGVRIAGAKDDLLKLIKALKIPTLLTWKALDFLAEDHPLYAGRPGTSGQRGANFTQQNSDLLISIGARLDFGQIGFDHKTFARAAKKVIVDIDGNEIKKLNTKVDVSCPFDAADFIRELMKSSDKLDSKRWSSWLERAKAWHQKYPLMQEKYLKEKGVNNYVLMDILSDEMSPKDILVPGSSGACSEITMQSFRCKDGIRVLNTQGLGSMGFGIPAAIGGCIASGKRRTICIEGDGGFVMNVQELETVKRLNLPIKFFVLNNGGYESIINTQKNYFKGRLVGSEAKSGMTLPDAVKVAESYGIHAIRIKDSSEAKKKIHQVLAYDGPVICDVIISPDQVTAPRVTSKQRPDGTFISKPLEDMGPFLDRQEFLENMIIPPLEE